MNECQNGMSRTVSSRPLASSLSTWGNAEGLHLLSGRDATPGASRVLSWIIDKSPVRPSSTIMRHLEFTGLVVRIFSIKFWQTFSRLHLISSFHGCGGRNASLSGARLKVLQYTPQVSKNLLKFKERLKINTGILLNNGVRNLGWI